MNDSVFFFFDELQEDDHNKLYELIRREVKIMAKSILTPEGDLVNYDNLIAVSVEVRSVGVDEEHSEDEYCIIGTDVTNKENLLYHSTDHDKVMNVQRDITRWLQSEAFSTFEMPTADEGGDA